MAARESLDVDVSEIVTKFLLSTYRLQPTEHDMLAAVWYVVAANLRHRAEPKGDFIPLISGSSRELYIKPILSCVDDVDIMVHRTTQLAIPAGYSAPTFLPDEFYSSVKVFEIIDSQYPGFAYLRKRYILTKNIDNGRYNAVLDDRQRYVGYVLPETDLELHGPAATQPGDATQPSVDRVDCVRCLSWLTQAVDWPTRQRNHGWPDSATLDRVVSNGCDLVHVAHRLCRQDEWENRFQWRLSFSRAEVVLLNSWTPVQHIVYHMLRVFTKASGLRDITDSTGTKILSNYHIKTLMLWAYELKPRCWWNSDTNVVGICVELLHTLAVWLTGVRCKHYFVSKCNLLDCMMSVEKIVERLTSVTDSWLSTWFANNYILKCAQLNPDNVSLQFDDASKRLKLQAVSSTIVDWRRETALEDLWKVYDEAEYEISSTAMDWCAKTQSFLYFMDYFSNYSTSSYYVSGVAFLHCALIFSKGDLNVQSMDVLSILCGHFIGKSYSSQPTSLLLLSQGVKLMKAAHNSRNIAHMIEIELSKAYLHKALGCKDSDNDSIYCLANVYSAVLYYTTGQYQTAIDHCTLVTRSQDHSQCNSRVVQGELLPKIDDNIGNVLGLAVFYQYIRTAALNQQQQTQHVRVFNTELFAHYLLFKCLSATKSPALPREAILLHCRRNITNAHELYTADVLLYKSITISAKIAPHYKEPICPRQPPTMNPTELNTSELVELLQQSAVEHLTTYRQLEAREFGSVATIVTADFGAMYAYKRGDYQLCLHLSTQNVHTLLYACRMGQIYILPEFVQLLDDDIVSLTALTLIVNPGCRSDVRNIGVTQLTLSLYLMTQCHLKLRHLACQLDETSNYIQVAQRRLPSDGTLEHLMLKLCGFKILFHSKTSAATRKVFQLQ